MSTYFSLIPSGIMEKKDLSDGSKLTYALILGLSNRNGYCFASNRYLCDSRNCSLSTIQRQLAELKDKGCITVEVNAKNDRRITPVILASQFEKVSKNSKNKQYDVNRDAIDDALDLLWRDMKQ